MAADPFSTPVDLAQALDLNGDGSGNIFDPLTGTPTYYTDSPLQVGSPQTGDSGVGYGSQIFDLLKTGLSGVLRQQQQSFDAKNAYNLGRAGLTLQGQPVGSVQVGRAVLTPQVIVLGVVGLLGLAFILHSKG